MASFVSRDAATNQTPLPFFQVCLIIINILIIVFFRSFSHSLANTEKTHDLEFTFPFIQHCVSYFFRDTSTNHTSLQSFKYVQQKITFDHRRNSQPFNLTVNDYPPRGGLWGFTGGRFGQFRDIHLNLTGFRILRYVMGCGFSHFLCSGFGYFIQSS